MWYKRSCKPWARQQRTLAEDRQRGQWPSRQLFPPAARFLALESLQRQLLLPVAWSLGAGSRGCISWASFRSRGYGSVPKGTVLRSVWSHKDHLLFGVCGVNSWGGTLKVWQVPDTTAYCLGWFWKGTFPFKATGMKRPHLPADQSMAEAETRVSHHPHFLASETH